MKNREQLTPEQSFGIKLKQKVIQVLEKLRKLGEDVDDLQIAYNVPGVKQGKNFIGHVQDNKVVGKALFFQRESRLFNIFVGQMINGKPVGKGLKIQLSFQEKKGDESNNLVINFSKYNAMLLSEWSEEKEMDGFHISKDGQRQKHFKGTFNADRTMKSGKLELKQSEALTNRYEGQFQNNQFHGQGKICIPCQYQFQGSLISNSKEGLGIEKDLVRNTIYVGNFQTNQKNGYGEISYLGKKNIMLKGFWRNGVMMDGVFIDEKGEAIEKYDKRYIPII